MDIEEKETKPTIETKSSMEILSELFSTFHAEPPLIIKQEKSSENKKRKRKKKHKSKDKKHKKRSKKRKRSSSVDDSSNDDSSELDFDLAKLLVKQEDQSDEKKIKIEGTEISLSLGEIRDTIPDEKEDVKPSLKTLKTVESKTEEGEISSDDDHKHVSKPKKHKSKHKHRRDKSKEKYEKSAEQVETSKKENKVKHHHRSRSGDGYRSRGKEEINDFYKSRERDDRSESRRSRSPYKHSECKHKGKDEPRDYRDNERYSKYDSFYERSNDFYRPRERERSYDRNAKNDFYKPRGRSFERNRDDRWHSSKRSFDHSKDRKYRDRTLTPEKESSHIDKKKLLEIARKNAIQMMKSGSLPGALTLGPQAQEKVIAAIKAGGKTIEELTDFCKTLSKKEDLGELSDVDEDRGSESDNDKPFNHPFQIKDRPTTITMNIKNSVPLPIKSSQERTTELRMQFPVSSGQHHRKNEHEWVPVEPKKNDVPANKPSISLTKAVVPITPLVPPTNSAPFLSTIPVPPSVPSAQAQQSTIDISTIVSLRLSAMRKLQENPHDVQALSQMYKSTKEVQSWAESKQKPGQFTGSVGGNFLSQSELTSGYQAWAKKDQLQVAAPVSGGMGMHLLQKMGWKPGEGLGKEKTGALEPLLLEVKLNKRGLVATEETQRKRKVKQPANPKNVQGKHPVSLLGEYACKNKLGAPTYELCFECGPDHKKNFLFKVSLNGMDFKPNVASPNKKEAKANAATLCLQKLGVVIS